MPDFTTLTDRQAKLIEAWFGETKVVADHSWGLVDTTVLQLRCAHGDVVVKAAGPANHHIGREIAAHRRWTADWLATGSIGRLLQASEPDNMLVVDYLPGRLVQNDPSAAGSTDTHRQAGALLARFHDQDARVSEEYLARVDRSAVELLDRRHRIAPDVVNDIRGALATHRHGPIELVPTHGDWSERNWLVDDGIIRVIDLGRADWRPRETDFSRLTNREWRERPELEAAFVAGYGSDPRGENWPGTLLREAIGTAVWAYAVGDTAFEDEGHAMIDTALRLYR